MITKKHLQQRINALELDLSDAVQKLAAIRGHLDRAGFSPHRSATDEVVRHVESLVDERLGYRSGYVEQRDEAERLREELRKAQVASAETASLRNAVADANADARRYQRERNEAHERIARIRDVVRQSARNSLAIADIL